MDDKIKVLIASVLKPADDVRSYAKIGKSLAQTNKYEVNIIGFNSKKKSELQNIFLFPLFNFKRNSLKRLFASFSILKIYLQLKPKLIIVNSPELLWLMFCIKILFGTTIIYDIQENYRYNIQENVVYSGLTKRIAKLYIRITEGLSKHFLDGYILAEEIYEKQLHFIHNKDYIKLLNKSVLPISKENKPSEFTKDDALRFIYTGTIGKEYGTLEAIKFCKKIYKFNPKITLTIIGYSSDIQYLDEVKSAIKNTWYVQLITSDKPIEQKKIVSEIIKSDIALLPYQLNPNISGRFPTKIYDYLALAKPMVIPPNTEWMAYLDQYKAGIVVDFDTNNIQKFLEELHSHSFYSVRPTKEIKWQSQEASLFEFVNKILSK